MRMTKVLCLLLTLAMLLGCVAMFSSCSSDGEIKASGSASIDLDEYSLIYPTPTKDSISATFREQMITFANRLEAATGQPIIAYAEANAKKTVGKEILVGLTGRAESKEAYDSIKGYGFAIQVTDNKIVIVGSTTLLTLYAVQYFTEQYLTTTRTDGVLEMSKKVKANNLPMVELANSDESFCSLVYKASLDTEGGANDEIDYPYYVLNQCSDKLKSATGLAAKNFPKKADSDEPADGEILIGFVDRPEVAECQSTLETNEYGIFVKNGKVVATSWNDTALSKIPVTFGDMLTDATVTDESGKTTILLPEGLAITGTYSDKWVVDFPKPEGLSLYNTMAAGNEALQYLYMGEGVNADAFRTYCDDLKSAGYKLLTENEIEDSLFATFVNQQEGKTLYVTYNAFKHGKDEYDYEPRFKIVSAPLDSVTLPDEKILDESQAYKKVHDSTITQMYITKEGVGMCYVMMLEDGSFIIFDGGREADGETERLWDILTSLHTKAFGEAPSKSKPVRIAAWVMTHSHSDHYDVPYTFLKKHGKTGLMKLEYVLGNFPDKIATHNTFNPTQVLTEGEADIQAMLKDKCKYVKIHTGERYYFANLEIEVLATHEDMNPVDYLYFNDTSCVLRFTMRATDENGRDVSNESATVTSVWTGDAHTYESRFMTAMYGSYLKSDMVQIAHHGNVGCESSFYDCVQGTAVWFPNRNEAYRNYTKGTSEKSQFKVDYHVIHEIEATTYVYVADILNTTVQLTVDGADYENIFDAITGEPIEYGDGTAIKP